MDPEVVSAIAPLPEAYADLLGRIEQVLQADDEVRALWLAGSLGRRDADAGSDLDLVVTVRDLGAYADPGRWDVVEPLITTPIPGMPGCLAFTTRAGLRVDVVLETPGDLATTSYRRRVRVFDRDGLPLPDPEPDLRRPDVARMEAIVMESLRQWAIYPFAVVAREDWLLGQAAVGNYHRMLYDLFVEANQPLPEMGVKQWTRRLTAEQAEVLTALPPPSADRDSVERSMRAVRDALRTHGRAALEGAGGTWPEEVAETLDTALYGSGG